ncbi:MAG: hypothetical protein JW768_10650 [Chitinispirillaceae bacterium]|nr:hypothetical protein [Chitinispirillaceae bacterium]
MFAAFLFSLNLPDTAIYSNYDIYSKVFDQLTETTEPYGLAIIGPTVFDIKKHSVYPVFSLWKTNNQDNIHFLPPEMAYILIIHLTTNELIILPLYRDPGKMPLPEDEPEPTYPPGYNKKARQYSYDKIWRDISSKDMTFVEGKYKVKVLCGKMLSNEITFSLTGSSIKPENSSFIKDKTKSTVDFTDEYKTMFSKSDGSPDILKSENAIQLESSNDTIDKDQTCLIIRGSFNLPTNNLLDKQPLEITALIQYAGPGGLAIKKLVVPQEMIKKGNNNVQGYFAFNVLENFYNQTTKKFTIPEEILVNAVYGTSISNVIEIHNVKSSLNK